MYTVEKASPKKSKQAPATIQCFRFGKFITSYLTTTAGLGQISTLASTIQDPSEHQNWIDLINPARWRINPLNLYAGLMNALEESQDGANYHSSSRHGASNSLWNSRARLVSNMRDHYSFTGKVRRANTSGRFNSEAWERYAWNKGKKYFEFHAKNAGYKVNWIAGSPGPGTTTYTWNATLNMNTKWWGSSVGVSIRSGDVKEANSVKLAINYQLTGPGNISAWNGQMYPVQSAVSSRPLNLPIISLGSYNVPYSFFL